MTCTRCGVTVILCQRHDGSRVMVGHDGSVNCPAGDGDQLLPGLLGSR